MQARIIGLVVVWEGVKGFGDDEVMMRDRREERGEGDSDVDSGFWDFLGFSWGSF